MQKLIISKLSYFLYFVFGLLIVWLNSQTATLPLNNLVLVIFLFTISYACYLKVKAKSFKLMWLYTVFAFSMLALGQLVELIYSPNYFATHLSYLSAWLFAILALETTPNVSETPLSHYTSRRVSAILFCIALFTYLMLIPQSNSSELLDSNQQIALFNTLVALLLTYRLFESWQSSASKEWLYFYGAAIFATLAFSISSISEFIPWYKGTLSTSFKLIAIFIFFGIAFQSIAHRNEFRVKKHFFPAEIYLIIQLIIFTSLHLMLSGFHDTKVSVSPIESMFFIAWSIGILSFVIYLINKSWQSKQAQINKNTQLSSTLHESKVQLSQLKNALKNSEEKAIVTSSNNAILTVSTEGIILSVNPAAVQMFQYLEDELIGQPIATLFEESDELHFFFQYRSNLFALQRKKSGLSKESQCQRADGYEFPAQVEMQWAERQGSPLIAITFINLTARKLAEQQTLEQKDAFLANVSHEFRTPLTLINGVIDKFIESTTKETEVEDLTTAKRNSLRLVRMVEQLLELSKLQESPQLNIATYELAHLLRMPLDSFKQLCEQQALSFTSSVPSTLFIDCDAEGFEKIIFNLLANAVKYTPKGGSISVNVHQIDDEVAISITDTGIGINKSSQDVIFNRFERAQDLPQQAQFGVGIGLSLVNELVKAHQWRINLVSESNKGSKFTLHIPVTQQTKNAQKTTSSISQQEISSLLLENNQLTPKSSQSKNKRVILLIEDNKDMQQHVQQLLDTQHHCIAADDGESGISLAIEYIPDVIVCDIMLTGIDGFEVLRTLKSNDVTSHIPIILLTARSDLESRLKGLDLNADEYLGKPFNRKELLSRIDNLIQNRERLKEVYVNKYLDTKKKERKDLSHQNISSLTTPETPEISADDNFLERLEHFVAEHFTNPQLEITEIAAHLAMSERQLQRKLRVLLGSTPNNYLKEFRLSKAKDALANGKPIGHIALDVGFSSQTYFGRCFKEKYNMTPKQYQSSLIK